MPRLKHLRPPRKSEVDTTPATPRPSHLVYPGGPDCNPNCPGEHSMYHDGYADGYENAANAHDALLAALRALVEPLSFGWGKMPPPAALEQARALLRDLSPEEEGQ